MKWHFSQKRPSDKTRDPIAGEFFASEAIKNAGEALVREGIQNSLDARRDRTNGMASVRIYVSGDAKALSAANVARWVEGAWPHLEAPNNGLQGGAVTQVTPCSYLVFEDFGTTGLIGDPKCFEPEEGSKNAFFYFFRAEGKTEKSGDDRGRWGIGKQVFPRSSKAQMYFGYTETDLGSLLMGGCVLKHHQAGDDWYKPDGYFGEQEAVKEDILTVPVISPEVIAQFRRDFNLKRGPGERGLSIVVPWVDENREDSKGPSAFDRNTLALAVLDGYFVPVLEGRLEVEVEDHTGSYRLTKDTYGSALESIESVTKEPKTLKIIARLKAYLQVAEQVAKGDIQVFELPPCPEEKASWREEMLGSELTKGLREALDSGSTIGVSATLSVRPKKKDPKQDSFRCYLRKTTQFLEKPCHIREDLIISNVDCSKVSNFACLVRIENGPLATLLGDSEGPAHTEWQGSSRNFKDKYIYGGVTIKFVSDFAAELLRRIYTASKQLDRALLDDLFYDAKPDPAKSGHEPKAKPSGGASGGDSGKVKPQPSKPQYRTSELADGFVVASVGGADLRGQKLKVSAAYETSKGNAFKAYAEADFTFSDDSIEVACEGCTLLGSERNTLEFQVLEEAFALRATGFDRNRDLIVRVDRQGGSEREEAEAAEPVEAS